MHTTTSRFQAIHRTRARLLREGYPRLEMFFLVAFTGLAGFAASFAMLVAGIDTMALRYVLAMGVAYIVFLLLLWLWLRTRSSDWGDLLPTGSGDGAPPGSVRSSGDGFAGGGGSFDGGGASGSVDFGPQDSAIDSIADKPLAAIAQAEEGAIPLAALLLVLAIALSSLFVVWSAPILFAEILVDGVLAASLYRRLRGLDGRHWMFSALKRTMVPFILTTLLVAGAAWAMQAWAPEARSLGDVLASR